MKELICCEIKGQNIVNREYRRIYRLACSIALSSRWFTLIYVCLMIDYSSVKNHTVITN